MRINKRKFLKYCERVIDATWWSVQNLPQSEAWQILDDTRTRLINERISRGIP